MDGRTPAGGEASHPSLADEDTFSGAQAPDSSPWLRTGDEEVPWGAAEAFRLFLICIAVGVVSTVPALVVFDEQTALAVPVMELVTLFLLWAVVGARHGDRGRRALLGPEGTPLSIGRALAFGGAAAVGTFGFEYVATSMIERMAAGPLPEIQHELADLLLGGVLTGSLATVSIVVFAPLAEELLFRGLLFQGLERRGGWWAAAGVSSALFAVLHAEETAAGNLVILPLTFVFGLVACWLLTRTRTILSCIVFHALANGAAVLSLHLTI